MTKRSDRQREYERRNPWVLHLEHARRRCNSPKQRYFKYYGGSGIRCLLTVDDVRALWYRDNAGAQTKPSLDRKDSTKDYTFDNCEFVELSENVRRRNDYHRALKAQEPEPQPTTEDWED